MKTDLDRGHDALAPKRKDSMKLQRNGFVRAPSGCLAAWLFVGLTASLLAVDLDPQLVGQWPGYRRGHARAVAVAGHYAYMAADGGGLHVIDITYPAHPRLVAALDPDVWRRRADFGDVTVSGNYAYVVSESNGLVGGLDAIDVSEPADPRRVGRISGFQGKGMAVEGDKVYVAAGPQGLLILKASQPGPRRESSFLDAAGFRVAFQGATGQAIRLQRSQDLKAWADWMDVIGTGGRQEVVDANASAQARQFYRAVVKP